MQVSKAEYWATRKYVLLVVSILVVLVQVFVLLAVHLLSLNLGQKGFYPIVLGGDDGKFHYAVAKYMLASGDLGANFDLFDVSIWPTVMAVFMKYTGSDSILMLKQLLLGGRLLDIAGGMIAIEALRKAAGNRMSAEQAAWARICTLCAIGLFPSGLYYSFGSLYRDALIYGFHLLTVGLLLQVVSEPNPKAKLMFFVLSLVALYCLYQFRQYAAYAVILAAVLWGMGQLANQFLLRRRVAASRRNMIVWGGMSLLVLVISSVAWYSHPVQQLIAFRDSYLAVQGSNLRISFTGKNPIQAFPLFIYSFVSNVIGPLPWQIKAASNALNFVIEVPLLAYVGFSIWIRRRGLNSACAFLIFQATAWFAMISFSNDNLGTASRLRVLGWQCLFVVFAYLVGTQKRSWSRRKHVRYSPLLIPS